MSTAGLEKQPTGSQHFLQRHHEQSPLGAQLGASLLSPASPRRSVFEGVFRNSTRPRSNSCVRPGHHSPRRPSPTLTKLAIPRKPPLMVRGGAADWIYNKALPAEIFLSPAGHINH